MLQCRTCFPCCEPARSSLSVPKRYPSCKQRRTIVYIYNYHTTRCHKFAQILRVTFFARMTHNGDSDEDTDIISLVYAFSSHFFRYYQNGCSLYVVPVLHNPVILAPIHTVPHSQHSVVQSCLGADPGVIHPTVVQLKREGGGKGRREGKGGEEDTTTL